MKKLLFILVPLIAISVAVFGSISAFAAPAQKGATVLRWVADPTKEGLKAFEGVEDDPSHSEPGVTHIFVQGDTYRFNMDTKQRESPGDRQRNEVKGMVQNGNVLTINLGETWRFTYSMFIPTTLKGTTSFTHIMQMKRPGQGTAPLMTMDLRRSGSKELIALKAWVSNVDVATTDLAPLRGHWIDTEVTVTAGAGTAGKLHWKLVDGGKTIVDAEKDGVNLWLGDRLRPKWGIYRSVKDTADILDTYLLLRNMKAYQIQ
jgi:chitin-binding protein